MRQVRNLGFATSLILLVSLLGLLAPTAIAQPTAVTTGAASTPTLHVVKVSVPASQVAQAPPMLRPAASGLTFPRTVMIETFTAVWCHYCPGETQALYDIDQNSSHSTLVIAELHSCASAPGQGPCLENYVPPDNTTSLRGTFYGICGFPDVFVDGQHGAPGQLCGDIGTMVQERNAYLSAIHNASQWPGNVSITDSAANTSDGVLVHENITSGLTGTYNAVTYLMQYIGKRNVSNGYGPHDLGWVVRETLHNGPVALTNGVTTPLTFHGPMLSVWNTLNLSVVSFVQNNSTKVIENANFAPVTTLTTGISSTANSLSSEATATITVTVRNSSTGIPINGAAVSVASTAGGTLAPATGTTSSVGTFTTLYTAPKVDSAIADNVTAFVNATDYTAGSATTVLTVNPLVPPAVATGLAASPALGQIALNWTAPATGALGVTYNLYSSATATGPFSLLSQTSSPTFVDLGVTPGQTLWFKVAAHDLGGFAENTTAVSATSVSVNPIGLPLGTGWWISLGGQNFTSSASVGQVLYLPAESFAYTYGANSYAVIAAPPDVPSVDVQTSALLVDLNFTPRLATLSGTVTPVQATVTIDGTALPVAAGAFSWVTDPGTYYVNASESGYQGYSKQVVLTPGNTTPLAIALTVMPSTGGSSTPSNSGISTDDTILILGVGAAIVVAAVLGIALMSSRTRRRPPTNGS